MNSGDTVTVSYTPPASNSVRDLAGNAAKALTDEPLENTTPPPVTVESMEITSEPGTDETYAVGDAVAVTVTFSAGV